MTTQLCRCWQITDNSNRNQSYAKQWDTGRSLQQKTQKFETIQQMPCQKYQILYSFLSFATGMKIFIIFCNGNAIFLIYFALAMQTF